MTTTISKSIFRMKAKAWIFSLIAYVVLSAALIFLFDWIWPDNRVWTTVVPLIVGALITHLVRKLFDFVFDYFNRNKANPLLGVSIKIDYSSRRFVGYGASNGEVIQAGNFKANYEVEVELKVTIQNESLDTIYGLEVSFVPNSNLSRYKYNIIDPRENKLQPLEGNDHIDFKLRLINNYYDVYASEVDKELQQIYQFGKGPSLLKGSVLNLKYRDSRQKTYSKSEIIE